MGSVSHVSGIVRPGGQQRARPHDIHLGSLPDTGHLGGGGGDGGSEGGDGGGGLGTAFGMNGGENGGEAIGAKGGAEGEGGAQHVGIRTR